MGVVFGACPVVECFVDHDAPKCVWRYWNYWHYHDILFVRHVVYVDIVHFGNDGRHVCDVALLAFALGRSHVEVLRG